VPQSGAGGSGRAGYLRGGVAGPVHTTPAANGTLPDADYSSRVKTTIGRPGPS
jgi:hypothetical protein